MYYLILEKCVITLFCVLILEHNVLMKKLLDVELKDEAKTTDQTTPTMSTISNQTNKEEDTKSPTTTTNSPTEENVELEKSEYIIKIYEDQSGVIEQFKTKSKVENVRYTLISNDESQTDGIINKLEIDEISGVLRTKEKLISEDYIFKVKATVVQKTTTANVKLQIQKIPKFKLAFFKKHIEENKTALIWIAEATTKNCEYSITKSEPPGAGAFFSLNKYTGELKSEKIDRENEIFKNQVEANIKLVLSMKCVSAARKKRFVNVEYSPDKEHNLWTKEEQRSQNPFVNIKDSLVQRMFVFHLGDYQNENLSTTKSSQEKHDDKHCEEKETPMCDSLLEDSIEYSTDTMKILIIIDDINDNPPKFLEEEYFIGYPDKTLFSDIIPENIGRVKAVDKDEGINALIRYSLKNTKEIIIDPCTGILYPHYEHFKYEQLSFEAMATNKNGKAEDQNTTVSVTIDILKGYHIMNILVKKTSTESNKDIVTAIENSINAKVGVLKRSTVPSMYELSESREINTHGYDFLEYFVIYAHRGKLLLDLNKEVDNIKQTKHLENRIVWTRVLAETPYHLVHSKSFVSTIVVLMLLLCLSSLAFYIMYIRTGKYYRCLNYFKRTNTTTPLETNEGSIGTSDYVVSFARMNQNPTFNNSETEPEITKDMFTPVTLKALEPSTTNQIINSEELNTAPPILVNVNSSSRHSSGGGEDMLGLPSETRIRRKSTVSFNEIVEQYHTVH